MKILLLGDASNYHRALSVGLVRRGHSVTLASDGSRWMGTERDIDVSRPNFSGPLGGAAFVLKFRNLLRREFRGYDVVQLAAPTFATLRPSRLRPIFNELRRRNGSVFLTALGTDSLYVKTLTGPTPPLRYSEWHLGDGAVGAMSEEARRAWLEPKLSEYTDFVYDSVDGVVSALYEYHAVVSAARPDVPLAYGGIPIDLQSLPAKAERQSGPLRIYAAAHLGREREKGADVLFPIVREFAAAHPGRVEIVEPPNMPYREFLNFLGGVDVLVDQLYSYTPATSALLAMAMGAVAVTGGEPEYAEFIGEKEALPLINVSPYEPQALGDSLGLLLKNRELLADTGHRAAEFVARHNSADVVAARFEDFWQRRMK
ncbi:MAG: hypothetical protein K2L96_06725 [Muribaculaceae bacterium]|nr:hypothetical protein [Muribaculaceae bacterium]